MRKTKITGKSRALKTSRTLFFGNYSILEIQIKANSGVTQEMAEKLEMMASEMLEKAEEIVAKQEAPQQPEKKEDYFMKEWFGRSEEKTKADDDTPSEY